MKFENKILVSIPLFLIIQITMGIGLIMEGYHIINFVSFLSAMFLINVFPAIVSIIYIYGVYEDEK